MDRFCSLLHIYNYNRIFLYTAVFTVYLLSGCATQSTIKSEERQLNPDNFPVCYAYGCEIKQFIKLKSHEWSILREIFIPESKTAAEERKRIAKAIGSMERFVGPKTGTRNDKAGGLAGLLSPQLGQMDCIDEAENTSTYLSLMIYKNMIQHHELLSTANRILPYGWPHTTAVLRDPKSGEKFAVDSWFLENGRDAQIVPLTKWRLGWTPDI